MGDSKLNLAIAPLAPTSVGHLSKILPLIKFFIHQILVGKRVEPGNPDNRDMLAEKSSESPWL